MLAIVKVCKHWRHYLEGATYQVWVVTNYCNLRTFLTSKNLSRCEARWWKRFLDLDFAIEYCPGGKNSANGPFHHLNYIKSDKDNQAMHIVEYVTRSSIKDKRAQNTTKGVQASNSTKVISEPNQGLESQSTTNKNSQSTTQNARHDNGDIAIDFSVEKSKRPTNCSPFSKRKWTLTRKQQAVKRVQE